MPRETYRLCRRPDGIFDLVPIADLDAWVRKYRPDRVGKAVAMPKKVERGAWICVPGPDGHVRFIPKSQYVPLSRGRGLQVVPDIEPFQNVAIDGGVIGGRKQKRDMMRAYGLEEIGNEKPKRRLTPAERAFGSEKQHQARIAERTQQAWYKLTGEY